MGVESVDISSGSKKAQLEKKKRVREGREEEEAFESFKLMRTSGQ